MREHGNYTEAMLVDDIAERVVELTVENNHGIVKLLDQGEGEEQVIEGLHKEAVGRVRDALSRLDDDIVSAMIAMAEDTDRMVHELADAGAANGQISEVEGDLPF